MATATRFKGAGGPTCAVGLWNLRPDVLPGATATAETASQRRAAGAYSSVGMKLTSAARITECKLAP